MNSSLIDDSNDSAAFVSSLTQKRKASSLINFKNLKQAKITVFEPAFSENHLTFDDPKKSLVEDCNELTKAEKQTKDSTKLVVDSKCIESTSVYFDKKKKPRSNCPLCLKTFENDVVHLAHMKQCAKKNKMTTQQLLNALELQKKHMKERRDLGLPSQTFLKPKKGVKKKKEEQNQQIECDLSLGIALSKSLEKNESKSNYKEENYPVLDEFGFTSNHKTKSKKISKSILKERTIEDRQRIITEKAAIILLQEDEGKKSAQLNIKDNSLNFNSYLFKFQNKLSRLWRLSENDGKLDWYVEEIKNYFLTCNKENSEQKKNQEKLNLNNLSADDIHKEIKKLNLPKPSVNQDWKKMINNAELSDLVCTSKDEHKFYFHSLVAYVRCPVMLKKDYKIIFKNFDISTILIFLEYLYCGTLNSLLLTNVENLKILAQDFDFEELINVLNNLLTNLTNITINNEHDTPLSDTPDLVLDEIKIRESIEKTKESAEKLISDEKDLFDEEMVDLTQSSHGSSTVDEEENEFNTDKSYWSFLQYEKNKKEEELRKEEERENSIISTEMKKIETSMKQQTEIMKKILSEYEEKESDIQNKLELEKIYESQRKNSNDSILRGIDEECFFKSKINSTFEDCILLSSDSDTKNSRPEVESPPLQSVPLCSFLGEVPSFDPYENYNYHSDCNYSPVVHSQSLLADIKSPDSKIADLDVTLKAFETPIAKDSLHSTPVTLRRSPRIRLSHKKSEVKKRRSDFTSNRIIRKSLSLSFKSFKSSLNRKKSLKWTKRKSSKKENEMLNEITNSILCEFNKSPLLKSSTPVQNNKFVEITPKQNKEAEIEESVTPYPNYSIMEEASLKKHLAKYGLKKNLGKKKASKILKHIYDELHPFLNPQTGKLLKKISAETPKTSKNKKRRNGRVCKNKKTKTSERTAEEFCNLSTKKSNKSTNSADTSTEYDSDNGGFEDFEDILTQSAPSDPIDLPSAMKKFLELNPHFHRKILLYEPIWLGDLQKKLKESFKQHFKISDIMDYLDQKCITFRSEAQKKNNEKRNARKKKRIKLKKNHSTDKIMSD